MKDWAAIAEKFPNVRTRRTAAGPGQYPDADFQAMVMASTPDPVSEAIECFRVQLDADPFPFALANNPPRQTAVFAALEEYFGISPRLAAYTFSTTMALVEFYVGLRITHGDEILTSRNEHFTTTDTLAQRARRDGTEWRQIDLYGDSRDFTDDEVITNLTAAIRPRTRALGLTWVYSSDGVKLPLAKIADLVKEENRQRPRHADKLLLIVDGVHGFGVENANFADLGCDLFAAGTHKWVFGPRGTAIIAGTEDAWAELVPLAPTSTPSEIGPGRVHAAAGLRAYEHFWALEAAFKFLLKIGKREIHERVHHLARRLKDGLEHLPHITLRTPLADDQSSGIVCFDVASLTPDQVLERLQKDHGIRGTESSFDATAGRTHARLSVSILNSESDIDRALSALDAMSAITT